MDSDDANSKGFVLDGVPMVSSTPDNLTQMEFLVELVKKKASHNCILIDLRISDEDLVRRRAALWTDPVTNATYPGNQVLYSRKRIKEGWNEGEEDNQQAEELTLIYGNQGKGKAEEHGKDTADGEDENKDTSGEVIPERKTTAYLRNKSSYKILPPRVLDR
jgi:hypothetical protein